MSAALKDIEADVLDVRYLIDAVTTLIEHLPPDGDPTIITTVASAARTKCNKVLSRCNSEINASEHEGGER